MLRGSHRIAWILSTVGLATACAPAARAPLADGPQPATVASVATGVEAAPASSLSAALDAALRAAYPADQPGAAAIVVKDGQVLLRAGYGMADLEQGIAMRPEHVFRLGSITKQFTGAAILMLAQEGRLTLDDRLTRFFPDWPAGEHVTIRHLLGHTSGIRSYTGMQEWAPTRRTDLSLPDLVAVFRDQPYDFEPGERWLYNNSGYVLLGAIIEQLSGMSYADFVRMRIFEPLGMTSSAYGDARRITPNRIPGYSRRADELVNAEFISMTHPHAAGSLLSTVDDLARWDAAITRGELIGEAGWRQAMTPIRLNDGRSTAYGAGWALGRLGNYATAEHGGGIPGFSTNSIRVPEAGLFVAVLANSDNPVTGPGEMSLRLADMALGGVMDVPAIAVDTARLRDYVGVYRIDDTATRAITLADGTLYSQRSGGNRLELRPVAEDEFFIIGTGSRLRFERRDGVVTAMVLEPRSGMGDRARRTGEAAAPPRQAVTLPSAAYAAYPGTYRLAPNFEIRITREGDRLYAQATGQQRLSIMPESETRFFFEEVDAVVEFHFEGDTVTALTLHQGGRSMPAPRID
jgi:D-alanyl-D-alanine carboxypeptidase